MARNLLDSIWSGDERLARDILNRGTYAQIDCRLPQWPGTALFGCCVRGYRSLADLLLQGRADANSKNENLATPLHGAVDNGQEAIVQLLLRHQADVNAATERGDTALHLAAYRGFDKIAQCLVLAGADITRINLRSLTPEMLAASQGHAHLAEYLAAVRDVQHPDARRRASHDAVASLIPLDPPSMLERRQGKAGTPASTYSRHHKEQYQHHHHHHPQHQKRRPFSEPLTFVDTRKIPSLSLTAPNESCPSSSSSDTLENNPGVGAIAPEENEITGFSDGAMDAGSSHYCTCQKKSPARPEALKERQINTSENCNLCSCPYRKEAAFDGAELERYIALEKEKNSFEEKVHLLDELHELSNTGNVGDVSCGRQPWRRFPAEADEDDERLSLNVFQAQWRQWQDVVVGPPKISRNYSGALPQETAGRPCESLHIDLKHPHHHHQIQQQFHHHHQTHQPQQKQHQHEQHPYDKHQPQQLQQKNCHRQYLHNRNHEQQQQKHLLDITIPCINHPPMSFTQTELNHVASRTPPPKVALNSPSFTDPVQASTATKLSSFQDSPDSSLHLSGTDSVTVPQLNGSRSQAHRPHAADDSSFTSGNYGISLDSTGTSLSDSSSGLGSGTNVSNMPASLGNTADLSSMLPSESSLGSDTCQVHSPQTYHDWYCPVDHARSSAMTARRSVSNPLVFGAKDVDSYSHSQSRDLSGKSVPTPGQRPWLWEGRRGREKADQARDKLKSMYDLVPVGPPDTLYCRRLSGPRGAPPFDQSAQQPQLPIKGQEASWKAPACPNHTAAEIHVTSTQLQSSQINFWEDTPVSFKPHHSKLQRCSSFNTGGCYTPPSQTCHKQRLGRRHSDNDSKKTSVGLRAGATTSSPKPGHGIQPADIIKDKSDDGDIKEETLVKQLTSSVEEEYPSDYGSGNPSLCSIYSSEAISDATSLCSVQDSGTNLSDLSIGQPSPNQAVSPEASEEMPYALLRTKCVSTPASPRFLRQTVLARHNSFPNNLAADVLSVTKSSAVCEEKLLNIPVDEKSKTSNSCGMDASGHSSLNNLSRSSPSAKNSLSLPFVRTHISMPPLMTCLNIPTN